MKMKRSKTLLKKQKSKAPMKKKNLSKVTTNEFFEQSLENDAASSDEEETENGIAGSDHEAANGSDSEGSEIDPAEHKKSLMKLQDTDPEFYKFLKQNDTKLLDFNLSDEDDEAGNDEEDQKHVPNEELEVGSDESDYEAEKGDEKVTHGGPKKVTLQLLKTWQNAMQNDSTAKTLKCVIEAFHAALQTITGDPDKVASLHYRVEGSSVFNGVVQLCVLELPSALRRFLKLPEATRFEAHKAKRFVKIKGQLKSYLTDLIEVIQNVTSSNVLTILLKHLHQMLPYTQSFSSLGKPLLKILLKLWSSGEETVRVVAFLSILRLATGHKESLLDTLLKTMYVKYVENAKFVSPSTLPGINFMRHSLTEIYLLDSNLSYKHAFLYIRQLAIHLRNAMTLKKKENFQAVYNWQFINSLRLWADLIIQSKNQSPLRSLLYPLVQIITGTIKLIPTAQYYPLRFHCVEILINISRDTDTYIPVLPFLLEILNLYDFDKKHKTVSMKPISLMCLLRVSKAQLQENGFKDSVIETIYQLILESAAKESHTLSYPDMHVPCIMQLKAFLKKCHVANYCRKIKQLLEKIHENSVYIEKERAKVVINLKDTVQIRNWENNMKNEGTPLAKFYESWIKVHKSLQLKLITQNEEIGQYNLPAVRKSKKHKFGGQGGSSDDSDLDMPVEKIDKKRSKRGNKNKKRKINSNDDGVDLPTENTDIVEDMNVNDWN